MCGVLSQGAPMPSKKYENMDKRQLDALYIWTIMIQSVLNVTFFFYFRWVIQSRALDYYPIEYS